MTTISCVSNYDVLKRKYEELTLAQFREYCYLELPYEVGNINILVEEKYMKLTPLVLSLSSVCVVKRRVKII